jgi:hypothetical protein
MKTIPAHRIVLVRSRPPVVLANVDLVSGESREVQETDTRYRNTMVPWYFKYGFRITMAFQNPLFQ